jgi:hypothetical protein
MGIYVCFMCFVTDYNELVFDHAGSGGGKFQMQGSETLEGKVLLN